jgi:hypothetical protein
MSSLESQAKAVIGPLVFGRGAQLGIAEQELVATWTLKTCLVHTAMDAENDGNEQLKALYADLYSTRKPSQLHRIMIGAHCDPGIAYGLQFKRLLFQPPQNHHSGPAVSGSLMTLAIGHFVGQVMYFPLGIDIEPPSALTLIWPFANSFIWPTGFFDANDLTSIAALQLNP